MEKGTTSYEVIPLEAFIWKLLSEVQYTLTLKEFLVQDVVVAVMILTWIRGEGGRWFEPLKFCGFPT